MRRIAEPALAGILLIHERSKVDHDPRRSVARRVRDSLSMIAWRGRLPTVNVPNHERARAYARAPRESNKRGLENYIVLKGIELYVICPFP